MKVNKIIIALLLVVSLASCKNEEKVEPKVAEPLGYIVTLNTIVKENDTFQVFYSEAADLTGVTYEEGSSVRVDIIGSPNAQDVVFNLPEDVTPTFIRIDFGYNKAQKDIQINGMNIQYLKKKIEIPTAAFFDYFAINENTVKIVDKSKGIIQPIVPADGNSDPVAFSGQVLFEKLATIQQ